MVEVLFGESEAGAMKAALKSGKLGSDVICLSFALEIGDIQKPVTGEYRSKLLYNLLYQEQWGKDREMSAELKTLGKTYSEALSRFHSHIDRGEPVRIWYSSAPYSLCGLLWLCSEIYGRKNNISVVRLPHIIVKGSTTISYSSWGEVAPNKFEYFLGKEQRISAAEIMTYAQYWNALKRENAPLRAVVNGSVMSVPASFYDFLIWKNLDEIPVKEAVLIGKILSEDHIGVGDWWYARRIDKFISQNRIKIIRNSPRKYERLIAKNRE